MAIFDTTWLELVHKFSKVFLEVNRQTSSSYSYIKVRKLETVTIQSFGAFCFVYANGCVWAIPTYTIL